MGVVQLGLVMLALTVCDYNSVLQECLDDQGVNIIFEVSLTMDHIRNVGYIIGYVVSI